MFAYKHYIHSLDVLPAANREVGGLNLMRNAIIPFIPPLNSASNAISIKYTHGIVSHAIQQIRIDVPNHGLIMAVFIYDPSDYSINANYSQCFCTPDVTSIGPSYSAFMNPGCSVDAAWVNLTANGSWAAIAFYTI